MSENKLNLAIEVSKLNTVDLSNRINVDAFLNGCKFLNVDVRRLISAVYDNYYVTEVNEYNCFNLSDDEYGVWCILNSGTSKKMFFNNANMLSLLPSTERESMIERYVSLTKRNFNELIRLYEQYVMIQSLRKGVSLDINRLLIITEDVHYYGNNNYGISISLDVNHTVISNTVLPDYYTCKKLISEIKKTL